MHASVLGVAVVTDRRRSHFLAARSHLTEGAPLDAIERRVRTTARPARCARRPTAQESQDQSLEVPRLTVPGVGQPAFEALVLGAYQRHCAITDSRIEPVLDAAHVRPVEDGGIHGVDNGLLLRGDVHKLFDDGYLNVDGRFLLRVSPRLKSQFGNEVEF